MEHSIQVPVDAVKAVHSGAGVNMQEVVENYKKIEASLPIDKKLAWLQLAVGKGQALTQLNNYKLELQKLLIPVDVIKIVDWEDPEQKRAAIEYLVELQNALTEYNKGVKQLPEMRKGYTRYLDRIYDELMQPEKHAQEWEVFIKLKASFIQLRSEKEIHDGKIGEKQREAEKFIAHIKNEYIRLQSDYKIALTNFINDAYTILLEETAKGTAKINNDEELKALAKTTWTNMQNTEVVPIGSPVKFVNYTLHTKEELLEISKSIPAEFLPDYASILQASKTELWMRFQMYWQDKPNALKAKEYIVEQGKKAEELVKDEAAREISVNNLLANAGSLTVIQNSGLKPTVKKNVIKTADEDPAWALKIITAMQVNWTLAAPYVRVKKWGNLSISQMAAALDEAGVKVGDVEYAEEVK